MKKKTADAGFTILELIVAMAITLVISGAVYTMMAQGQTAFTREPLLTDAQQQIRIAMDRIQGDVIPAAMGLGTFFQAFGPGQNALDPLNGVANTVDRLEIRTSGEDCAPVPSREANSGYINGNGNSVILNLAWEPPSCYPEPGYVVIVYQDGNSRFGWGHNFLGNGGNEKVNLPSGRQPADSQTIDELDCPVWVGPGSPNATCPYPPTGPGAPPRPPPVMILQMARVVYRVAADTDGVPSLFRSSSGGTTGANNQDPAATNPPGTAWQLIARGIENMQAQYQIGPGNAPVWVDTPPAVANNNYDQIVRRVRVTLTARTIGNNRTLAGQTTVNGVTALRTSLTGEWTPRAAIVGLSTAPVGNVNRWH